MLPHFSNFYIRFIFPENYCKALIFVSSTITYQYTQYRPVILTQLFYLEVTDPILLLRVYNFGLRTFIDRFLGPEVPGVIDPFFGSQV